MPDSHFLSATASPASHSDVFGPLQGGERRLWQGRCAVAEYAFDEAASLPRWALTEATEVLVTDHRVVYAYTRADVPGDLEVTSGELRWLWPQHVRVQPGARTTGRAAAAAQLQLVCAASDGSFPALVFAGGDLATVGDADKLANLIRHAIARFRIDNADKLGLSVPQARMLSRLLIGPEFSNFQGGEGQTVTVLGALSVHRPADPEPPAALQPPTDPAADGPPAGFEPAVYGSHAGYETPGNPHAGSGRSFEPDFDGLPISDPGHDSLLLASLHQDVPQPQGSGPADPPPYDHAAAGDGSHPASVSGTRMRLPGHRPGLAADEARALQAAAAEQATHLTQPDLASRAADLAARVASLISSAEEQAAAAEQAAAERAAAERAAAADRAAVEERAAAEKAQREADLSEVPTTDLTVRAATARRAAARFASNSAKGKAGVRRPEHDIGSTTRGKRTH